MIRRLRWRLTLLASLLITAITASGCTNKQPTVGRQETEAVPVKTVAAVAQEIQRRTTQPATVHPFYRAELQAKVSGYVDTVRVDIGDFVEADTPLAVIAVPEIRKQREVVEARIIRYESEEAGAAAGVTLAEANVRAAEARLSQARSELHRAQASLAAMEAEFTRRRTWWIASRWNAACWMRCGRNATRSLQTRRQRLQALIPHKPACWSLKLS
jgi:HlyD family secretion protein